SMLHVERYAEPGKEPKFEALKLEKPVGNESWRAAPHHVADGLDAAWSDDKPGLVFSAAADAQTGQHTTPGRYQNFGGSEHLIGFRLVVGPESPRKTGKLN